MTDFRSYRELRLAAGPEPVVVTGPNGAGKTNLLEALSFLSPGRGLRGARLAEADRRVEGDDRPKPWAVAAEVATFAGVVEIGTGRDPEPGRERRVVKLDGREANGQAALAEALSVVWLAPEMDGLFIDGPKGRRRFLDRLVFGLDPAQADRLAAHDRARRERSRLLRAGAGDESWLAALEKNLAEQAVAIAAARLDLISRLNRLLEEAGSVFPRPGLKLAGEPEDLLGRMPALAAEERLRERLSLARAHDAETGASEGAHRSDLVAVQRASGMPAGQCSTGEQKAFLIAILLAHARLFAEQRGQTPLLLLDEVVAHLDERRRNALFEEFLDLGVQAWLTGTDRAVFAPLEGGARFFEVENSVISEG